MLLLHVMIVLGNVVSIEENKRADTDRQLVDVSYAVSEVADSQKHNLNDIPTYTACWHAATGKLNVCLARVRRKDDSKTDVNKAT